MQRAGTVSYGVSSYGYDVRVGTKFKIFTNATTGGLAVIDPKKFTDDFVTLTDDLKEIDNLIGNFTETEENVKTTLELINSRTKTLDTRTRTIDKDK